MRYHCLATLSVVTLLASACSQVPGAESQQADIQSAPQAAASAIVNGGFESGLTGWTVSGTATASTKAHGGSHSVQVGGQSVAGTSSVTQTFTVPQGASPLSLWYQGVCQDTVKYAWASATLTDNEDGSVTTLLASTCTKSGSWTQISSGALTAGHSMTLTLSNHGEVYKTDYNYTLFDDVQLTGNGPPPPGNDFSLALSPPSGTVAPGASASFTVGTALVSGSAEAIALSVAGLPAGVTGSFGPASITAGQAATLTLSASSSAPAGSATFTVTGNAASAAHSASASLAVAVPAGDDFSLALGPASQTVAAGSSVSYSISTAVTSGSAQTVAFSVGGLPAGVTGSFSPASVSSGQGATLTLAAGASAAAGSASFTVTGTAKSGSHSAGAAVTVTSAGPGTGVGPNGGTVDHLYFAVVGDTRPSSVDATSSYPTAIITRIYQEIEGLAPRPQFVLGTGDYMYANTNAGTAQPQIALYMQARHAYSGTFFPAMGNHECDGYTAHNCTSTSQSQNIQAFMGSMLAPLGRTLPYYSFPVSAPDGSWTAKFINVACNYWGSAQQGWLSSQLGSATTYTILTRHEPASATTGPCVSAVETLMTQHPYDLSLVGHTHTFRFTSGSKEIIIGNGGAPISGGAPYGFATIEKIAAGWQIKEYDYSTGLAVNTYTLP